ncbi:MAG: alpha/beta hydrolase family protein [Steroidobacteraceae bacterium]
MTLQAKLPALFLAMVVLGAGPLRGAVPPSQFGVDAPELARLGELAVGVRTLALVQRNQEDVLAFDPANGSFPKNNRALTVDLWYPAAPAPGAQREIYTASLPSQPPAGPVTFNVPGLAVRDAPPAGKGYPLVVVSHGYSNSPAAMTWLTENLASKGYVVAAIRHDDPPITDTARFPQLLVRRPLDIAFVTRNLRSILAREHLVDPARVALIGYSMGGYGALTAAGATLDPTSPMTRMVPGGLLLRYARGGSRLGDMTVKGLRAVITLAPAGGGSLAAWGPEGLRGIDTPLLIIAGDADRTLDYATGARSIFASATGTNRYLLTFKGCGHSIGLNPAPQMMRARLWDQDWFEDPVWRKDRVNAISAHFISAFLDRYVKDDASRDAYLNVSAPESAAGTWPSTSPYPYDAYSPGANGISVWKGFQRNHAAGLELIQAKAGPHAN